MGNSYITEQQFREAAEKFNSGELDLSLLMHAISEAFLEGWNEGEQKIKPNSINQSLTHLISNIHKDKLDKIYSAVVATKVIYEGLPTYLYLIHQESPGNGFPYSLHIHNMSVAYLLGMVQQWGSTSCQILKDYIFVNQDLRNIMFKLIHGMKDDYDYYFVRQCSGCSLSERKLHVFLRLKTQINKLNRFWGRTGLLEENELITLHIKAENGLLYFRNPISEKQYIDMENLELSTALLEAKKRVNDCIIPEAISKSDEEIKLHRQIEALSQSIAENKEDIIRLGKRLLGKKKAQVQIHELENQNEMINGDIMKLLDQLTELENNRAQELKMLQQKAEKQRSELQEKVAALEKQKDAFLGGYQQWYCLNTLLNA